MIAWHHVRALVDGRFAEGLAVLVEGGRIVGVVPVAAIPRGAERRDGGGAMLVPGFVDIQVNGGGVALFNVDPSVATFRRIG